MPKRIADQDGIDTRLVESQCHGVIVPGQHGDCFADALFSDGTRSVVIFLRQVWLFGSGGIVDMVPSFQVGAGLIC